MLKQSKWVVSWTSASKLTRVGLATAAGPCPVGPKVEHHQPIGIKIVVAADRSRRDLRRYRLDTTPSLSSVITVSRFLGSASLKPLSLKCCRTPAQAIHRSPGRSCETRRRNRPCRGNASCPAGRERLQTRLFRDRLHQGDLLRITFLLLSMSPVLTCIDIADRHGSMAPARPENAPASQDRRETPAKTRPCSVL